MDMMKLRGYRIIGDHKANFQPVDAFAQFSYRGFVISMSTADLSIGGCQTEVLIFDKDDEMVCPDGFEKVEDAIDYINSIIQ